MSHMRVSNYVDKAFQLAFLKLKRRRKGVGVGVTAALITNKDDWLYNITDGLHTTVCSFDKR